MDHLIPAKNPDPDLTRKNELVIWWIVLFLWITDWKWKKQKDKHSDIPRTSNKLWRGYQLAHLKQSPKTWKRDWRDWKFEDESRLSNLEHCQNWPAYWEESPTPEETCCHSNFSERPSASTDVRNSQGMK